MQASLPSLRVTIGTIGRKWAVLSALSAVALLAGCDVTPPTYQRPDTPLKTSFTKIDAPRVAASDTIQPDWWKQFQDPYLDALVEKAINGNFDIKVLAARIQVAGAQIGEARAGALPSMDLGAGASFACPTRS